METQKTTKGKKTKNPFEGMKSATGFDDWTLYKIGDFETIQKTEGEIFKGYFLGYKVTPKQNFTLFYFVTADGECLKMFGSGNLSYQLNKMINDGHLNTLVGIRYDGTTELDVEVEGRTQTTDVNQWTVAFDVNKMVPKDLLNSTDVESIGLLTTIN